MNSVEYGITNTVDFKLLSGPIHVFMTTTPTGMDETSINFDQLQDEINEAERYLREEVLRTKAQGYGRSFRSSSEKSGAAYTKIQLATAQRADPVTPTSSVASSSKKYANPESREKLLTRLMSEHGSKSSTPGSSRSSSSRQMFTATNNSIVSDHGDFGSSHLIADFGSRSSSPASSKNSTPHRDGPDESNGDVNYFFKTIKKQSGGNESGSQIDETLFFASDVVSPSGGGGASTSHPGAHASTLYDTDIQEHFLASHFLPQGPAISSQDSPTVSRGRSSSPPSARHRKAARPSSAAPTTSSRSTTKVIDTSARAREGNQRKYLKSKQEMISAAEQEFKQQHSFKPNLAPSKYSKGSNKQQAGRTVGRIDAMIQVHGQALANRERLKIELERSKMEQSCSFTPQLSKGTQLIMRLKAKEAGVEEHQQGVGSKEVAVSDRLYQQAGKHQTQKRLLKHQYDQAVSSECTFKPALHPSSVASSQDEGQRPLYERVGDVQRQQAMSRQVLMECYEEDDNSRLTHIPEINDKSRRILNKTRVKDDSEDDCRHVGGSDVGTRLMNEARNQLNRKYRLMEEREKDLASKVKNPALCPGSQRYVTSNPNINNASFIKRQEDHAKKVKVNISESRRKDEVESNQWFKPGITTKTNTILLDSRPEVIEETPEQRSQRLYRIDSEEIVKKRRQIEEEMYGNIKFVPTIDPISKELGNSTGVKELSENKRGQRLKSRAKLTVEQRESEECTFQPQISQSQKSYLKELYSSGREKPGPNFFAPHMAWEEVGCPVHGEHSNLSSRDVGKPPGSINMREPERMAREIRQRQLEKDDKRRAELIVREIDELQECSFQPKIHHRSSSVRSTQPVTVAGVGRHFELKHMKQQQDEAARQREEDAFRVKNVETFRRRGDGGTVVEPFRITQSSSRKSRAVAALENSENSNLTFHPVTNDFERRVAARQVIQMTAAS